MPYSTFLARIESNYTELVSSIFILINHRNNIDT